MGEGGTLLVRDIAQALREQRVCTRYQPIVRVADRRPVGLEVLARLDHPTHGTIEPDDFVPQLELAGLGGRLTDAVAYCAWHDHADHLQGLGLFLTLNVPLDVLMSSHGLDVLDIDRREAGLRAEDVLIELTERQAVADLDVSGLALLRRVLAGLRARGYGVALDDLGPGVPDISTLLTLPVTVVKLDRGLVAGAAESPEIDRLLRTLVTDAHAAGLSVIAEGIEDEGTWRRVAALGIEMAQGFLVARPLPASGVRRWLEDWERVTA